jgi:methanogenic corrinoid protein MtbC1
VISDADEARHPIQVVSQRTGLSLDVIRVWERRYGAVTPHRLQSGRRLYSDDHVARLLMLKRASERGLRIGDAVRRPPEELARFLDEHDSIRPEARDSERAQKTAAEYHLKQCREAVAESAPEKLQDALDRAQIVLSAQMLIDEVLVPLTKWIGDQWSCGGLRIAQEHMASAALRDFLGKHSKVGDANSGRPSVLMATPTDHLHELGALMASMACVAKGWRVHYLGPNLPAEEVVECARVTRPDVIALSIVFPEGDPHTADQLLEIRNGIGPEKPMFVGGRAAPSYEKTIANIGARRCADIADFLNGLDTLTARAPH